MGCPAGLEPAAFGVTTRRADRLRHGHREVGENSPLADEAHAAFAVGLKLFSEVMMENRKHPLFEPLRDSFKAFMIGLKKGPTSSQD